MLARIKRLMAVAFFLLFLALSASLGLLAAYQFAAAFATFTVEDLVTGFLRSINTAFISLATFELAMGINREYSADDTADNIYCTVRRTISRFVGVVAIALVLESLVMVVKYSQLDLAGNLYYPVAILVGASVLLAGLGAFLHLSRHDCQPREA